MIADVDVFEESLFAIESRIENGHSDHLMGDGSRDIDGAIDAVAIRRRNGDAFLEFWGNFWNDVEQELARFPDHFEQSGNFIDEEIGLARRYRDGRRSHASDDHAFGRRFGE